MNKHILPYLLMGLLTACMPPKKPQHVDNVCDIFYEYPKWYWNSEMVEEKWGIPIASQMAIIRQESSFQSDAIPCKGKILWVIPWKRQSSAYGYTQALKSTWEDYKRRNAKYNARRGTFSDAVDFIGWYADTAYHKAGIKKDDTYHLYLAYHEGIGGYMHESYRDKAWLVNVAKKVDYRAWLYNKQLSACRASLDQKPWYYVG